MKEIFCIIITVFSMQGIYLMCNRGNLEQIIEWKNYLVKVIGDRNIVKFAEIRADEEKLKMADAIKASESIS